MPIFKLMDFWCGAIAQLGERLTGSQEVSGSIPLSSTIDSKGVLTELVKAPFFLFGVVIQVLIQY